MKRKIILKKVSYDSLFFRRVWEVRWNISLDAESRYMYVHKLRKSGVRSRANRSDSLISAVCLGNSVRSPHQRERRRAREKLREDLGLVMLLSEAFPGIERNSSWLPLEDMCSRLEDFFVLSTVSYSFGVYVKSRARCKHIVRCI